MCIGNEKYSGSFLYKRKKYSACCCSCWCTHQIITKRVCGIEHGRLLNDQTNTYFKKQSELTCVFDSQHEVKVSLSMKEFDLFCSIFLISQFMNWNFNFIYRLQASVLEDDDSQIIIIILWCNEPYLRCYKRFRGQRKSKKEILVAEQCFVRRHV